MSDVTVTLGGNATPLKQAMAEARAAAGKLGEATGFEFGNRTAYMAEQRVRVGMDGVLRSLATAKDPIDALNGAIEGIARSTRAAGAAFIGFGVGTFLADEMKKAAESANEFYANLNDIFAVGDQSSKEFTDKAIKNFETAKVAYGKEGFFEYLIYGRGQRESLRNGEDAYQQALVRARAMREEAYKADADSESDGTSTRIAGQIEKINERYDAEIAKAREAGDSIVEIERAKADAIARIQDDAAKKEQAQQRSLAEARAADPGVSEDDKRKNKVKFAQQDVDAANDQAAKSAQAIKDAQAKVGEAQAKADAASHVSQYDKAHPTGIPGVSGQLHGEEAKAQDELKEKQSALADAQSKAADDLIEQQKALNALKEAQLAIDKAKAEDDQKESEGLAKSMEEAKNLQAEMDEAGLTGQQKIEALKKKISDDTREAMKLGPLQTKQQKQDAQNQITKDKIELKKAEAEQDAKVKEATERRASLLKEQTEARAAVATTQAEAMGFHGQVSSLRREGFGRAPQGGKSDAGLKAAQEAVNRLDKVHQEIAKLNDKIGGTA